MSERKQFGEYEKAGWTVSPDRRCIWRATGEKKTIRRFLWFPLTIGDRRRWLEFATFELFFVESYFYSWDYEQYHDYCLSNSNWYCERWMD